ncbi:MAG TPA: hypothetical protein VN841_16180 [Bryobacteraceae bacterium]|nr:hypothetical protein [Bryobacteraceae bacterium]
MRTFPLARHFARSWAAAVMMLAPVSAQWLTYPTAGVPKNADGSPNLTAPTPRAADGKPDLSGLWGNRCPSGGKTIFCAPEVAVPQVFGDIGRGVKGGLPYQPWAKDVVATRRAQNGKDDPTTHCLPGGVAKLHTSALLRKIVQVPGLVIFLTERNASYRQVFTDGRPLPQDPNPSWNGNSTGHWDGDTLVVETNGFLDGQWLDRSGSPLTDAAKMTEKIRRPNYGTLEIELTVDDPKAYTKPWTIQLTQALMLDTELLDYICLENEKDAGHLVGK